MPEKQKKDYPYPEVIILQGGRGAGKTWMSLELLKQRLSGDQDQQTEDAEFEVIEPKQLNNAKLGNDANPGGAV